MTARRAGRPAGSFGELSGALLTAAQAGPGTVRELAARAQVGFDAARYRAPYLVRAGALQVVQPGRPQVLGVAAVAAPAGRPAEEAFALLARSFWERPQPAAT